MSRSQEQAALSCLVSNMIYSRSSTKRFHLLALSAFSAPSNAFGMAHQSADKQVELARRVFLSEYFELHNAQPYGAPFAYKQPLELLRHVHDNLIASSRNTKAATGYRQVMINGGRKHSSRKPLAKLTPERVEKLKLGCANRGKVLIVRICSDVCRTAALQFLVKDQAGWIVPVSLYHASQTVRGLLRPGVVLAIREPWLKENRDGYFIRIDSPSDIDLWPDLCYDTSEVIDPQAGLSQARTEGGTLFARADFAGAVTAYEEGLYRSKNYKEVNTVIVKTLVHLNASAAYLKLSLPGKALSHLHQCNTEHLDLKQREKHRFRIALALYNLRLYQECSEYLAEQARTHKISDETRLLQEASSERCQEAETGSFNWERLYTECEKGQSPAMSDYKGPVKVAMIAGKGNGLVATKQINPGDLLLVANPIAVAGNGKKIYMSTVGVNCGSGSLDPPSVMQVIAEAYERLQDFSETGIKLHGLYAGPEFAHSAYTSDPFGAHEEEYLDAGEIEGIVNRNSFRARCITSALVEQEVVDARRTQKDQSHHLASPCGLYYLPSMINHSCIGNATFYFFGSVLVVRAHKRIVAGEEVLFSYCDSTETLLERRRRLSPHGFRCTCEMCEEDSNVDQAALATASRRLAVLAKGDPSEATILGLIKEFKKIHGADRAGPCYTLCHCYRMLSDHLSSIQAPRERIIAAEIAALEALGAKTRRSGIRKYLEHENDRMLVKDPTIAIQEAVICCLRLAQLCAVHGDDQQAESWSSESERLHDLEFGPNLFAHRMHLF